MEAELFLAEQEAAGEDSGPSAAAKRSQSLIADGAAQWPPGKRDQLTQKIVYWLCKRCRPLSLPERDAELSDVLKFASNGAYTTPSKHNVVRNLCVLSGKALAIDRAKVKHLQAGGVFPSTGISYSIVSPERTFSLGYPANELWVFHVSCGCL